MPFAIPPAAPDGAPPRRANEKKERAGNLPRCALRELKTIYDLFPGFFDFTKDYVYLVIGEVSPTGPAAGRFRVRKTDLPVQAPTPVKFYHLKGPPPFDTAFRPRVPVHQCPPAILEAIDFLKAIAFECPSFEDWRTHAKH